MRPKPEILPTFGHTIPVAPISAVSMGARSGGQDRVSGERSERSLDYREHAHILSTRSDVDDTPTG